VAHADWTVGELLGWTTQRLERGGNPSPRVDAEHLLAHALSCRRIELYVRHHELVPEPVRARFRELVRRRLSGEPVAYIEGLRGFHALGLDLRVDPRVLIPRPETEHLVDWLLEELRPPPAPPVALCDVGTGSGAIALALAHARPDAEVHGADRSPAALEVARSNAERLGLPVQWHESDLLEHVPPAACTPAGRYTAIAANLPYIPSAELVALPVDVREFEPRLALDGGPDGLDVIRVLVAQAPARLVPAGALYLEVGEGQAPAVAALLRERGYHDVATRRDLAGIERVVRGRSG
jgi:release factor glutamine methyltransferase